VPLDPIGSPFEAISAIERDVLNEQLFRRMIAIERKRTERSKEPFLLMLLDAGNQSGSEMQMEQALENMATALLASSRETDIVGWYKERTTVGVMFTGLDHQRQEHHSEHHPEPSEVNAPGRSGLQAVQPGQHLISLLSPTTGIMAIRAPQQSCALSRSDFSRQAQTSLC
jgi:hypothetical protein